MSLSATYEALFLAPELFDERNFAQRFFAIEFLEGADLRGPDGREVRAARLLAALMEVDERLFARLRSEILAGRHRGPAFRALLLDHCGAVAAEGPEYDVVDVFVNGLCSYLPMPSPVGLPEPEMVDFYKTPARVVLEVARWVAPGDVFVDLGAGLGQVVILVHLLTGAFARGLEIEPAYCEYARLCAAGLGVAGLGVDFIEGDARSARYDEGTVFFLYTPFTGELLATVFGLLQRESLLRTFTVVTYGPCTLQAGRQPWLRRIDGLPENGNAAGASGDLPDTLCLFRAG